MSRATAQRSPQPAAQVRPAPRSGAPTLQRSPSPTASRPVEHSDSPSVALPIQASLRVSSPADPAEREATSTAAIVARMPAPIAAPTPASTPSGPGSQPLVLRRLPITAAPSPAASPLVLRRPAANPGQPRVSAATASQIRGSLAGGAPLSPAVRRFMEPRFGANFARIRIHTDSQAAGFNARLQARAFTLGEHIFFGPGQYHPESAEGRELLAHELTHTIQQGAAPQNPSASHAPVAQRSPAIAQRLGLSDALDYFADKANLIPGFRMFTIILGLNPINMSRVDRSPGNIFRALIEFIPGGALITQALDNHGVFDRISGWVSQQIATLGMVGSSIRQAVTSFLDSLGWSDIFDLGGVWERAKRIFTDPIQRIISFAAGLATDIIRFIKEAILRPLGRLAEGTRGYDLLKAILGEDPVTGDAVPRTAETLIGGFMKLIGQEEIWQNIQRSRAIPRAWAWFQGAMGELLGFVRQIPGTFVAAFQSLVIADIILVPRAFAKIASVFGSFIGRFISWAGNTIWNLLQIIFEVVAPGAMVYIRRAAGAFRTILRNPIGFVGNLVRAGILGLRQFAGNFLTHLRASLIGWLTGSLAGANIYIPQGFNLREIIKFVLSVLGLTWQNIRTKLVRVAGETAVRAMETGFDLVMTLVTEGPAAAWEKIREGITNLREMVMEQVMTFVRDRIVQAAITRLVTSLNPAGAFIQAIIAIYNTVMFFIERLRQIAQVAMSFIDAISAIASGVIASAANRVERTMAGLLTLVISFLARIVGLGRVSDAVVNIVNRIRAPIDRALDRVVAWIVAQVRRLGSMIRGRDARSPEEKQRDLDRAVRELTPVIQPMLQRGTRKLFLRARILIWKRQYRLTDLSAEGGQMRAVINPTANMFSTEEIALGRMLEPILQQAEQLHLRSIQNNRQSAQRITRATNAARAGRPLPAGLTPDETVILLRRQGLLQRRRALERPESTIVLENRRRYVPAAGAYVATHLPGMTDTRSRFGRGRRWFGSVNRRIDEGTGETPPITTLRDEVEVARHQGNLPAARIGGALVAASEASGVTLPVVADVNVPGATNVVSSGEITFGRMAPMATDSSAGAGSTAENRGDASPAQLQAATDVRQGSYAVIFNTLSAAIRTSGDPILKLPGNQGTALRAVVEAFDAWKAIVTANPAAGSSPAATAAANRLRDALTRFLASTRGG